MLFQSSQYIGVLRRTVCREDYGKDGKYLLLDVEGAYSARNFTESFSKNRNQ